MASNTSVVMDGRDIGYVLPNADVKIFLTASVAIRALRRYNEQRKRYSKKSLEEIEKKLKSVITMIAMSCIPVTTSR